MNTNETEKRARAIRIISGLLQKKIENGCMPAEAAHAAAKVQELLERYQLTMLDIEGQKFNDTLTRVQVDVGSKLTKLSMGSLASAIAVGYDCKTIWDGHKGTIVTFVGFSSDAEVAKYVFAYLRDALLTRADLEGRKAGAAKAKLVRWRNNFILGAAGEIRRRMLEEKRQRVAAPMAPDKTMSEQIDAGTANKAGALVCIKQPQVQEFFKQHYPHTTKVHSRVRTNFSALDAGRRAGREIEIRRGMTHTPTPLLV